MDTFKTIQVLKALANGIDPVTGELLPPDHCVQQAEVVRALFTAIELLKNNPTSQKRAKEGTKWTEDEDTLLKEGYSKNTSVSDLAKIHQRTYGAIRSRLVKHGLIEPSSDAVE